MEIFKYILYILTIFYIYISPLQKIRHCIKRTISILPKGLEMYVSETKSTNKIYTK